MNNLELCNLLIKIFDLVVTYSEHINSEMFEELYKIRNEILEFQKKINSKSKKELQTFINKQNKELSLYEKVLNSANNDFLGMDMLKIQKILNYHIKDN